jgi:hypothetical protein
MKKQTLGIALGLVVIGFAGVAVAGFSLKTSMSSKEQASEIPDPSDFLSMRPQIMSLPTQTVSENEKEGLLFIREEEKLARDVYTALYEKWGLPIFTNISQSEQSHTEAVRTVLVKYSIADPVSDETVGKFTNPDFAKLYTELVTEGQKSELDALKVGAFIEDLDIKDLQERIAQTDNDDIKLVYQNLMKGSRNHLRAFVSQIDSRGEVYKPRYISQEEFDEIISSPRETGSAGDTGAGRGRRGQ